MRGTRSSRFWICHRGYAQGRDVSAADAVAAADDIAEGFAPCHVLSTGAVTSAAAESHSLFSVLREADDLGYRRLYIKLPPAAGEYLALYNRLIRAAGGKIIHLT